MPWLQARKRWYLLWIGSGPLGTLLLLLLKGSSPSLRSSSVLWSDNPPLVPITILLPPTSAKLTGSDDFPLLSITIDTKTRPPSRMMATTTTDVHLADPAGLLIIQFYFQLQSCTATTLLRASHEVLQPYKRKSIPQWEATSHNILWRGCVFSSEFLFRQQVLMCFWRVSNVGGQGRIKASQQPWPSTVLCFLSYVFSPFPFLIFLWDLWMVKENEQEFQMSSWQCFLVHDYTLVILEIQLRLEDNLD